MHTCVLLNVMSQMLWKSEGFLYEDIFLKIIDLGAELPERSLTQRGAGGMGGRGGPLCSLGCKLRGHDVPC